MGFTVSKLSTRVKGVFDFFLFFMCYFFQKIVFYNILFFMLFYICKLFLKHTFNIFSFLIVYLLLILTYTYLFDFEFLYLIKKFNHHIFFANICIEVLFYYLVIYGINTYVFPGGFNFLSVISLLFIRLSFPLFENLSIFYNTMFICFMLAFLAFLSYRFFSSCCQINLFFWKYKRYHLFYKNTMYFNSSLCRLWIYVDSIIYVYLILYLLFFRFLFSFDIYSYVLIHCFLLLILFTLFYMKKVWINYLNNTMKRTVDFFSYSFWNSTWFYSSIYRYLSVYSCFLFILVFNIFLNTFSIIFYTELQEWLNSYLEIMVLFFFINKFTYNFFYNARFLK